MNETINPIAVVAAPPRTQKYAVRVTRFFVDTIAVDAVSSEDAVIAAEREAIEQHGAADGGSMLCRVVSRDGVRLDTLYASRPTPIDYAYWQAQGIPYPVGREALIGEAMALADIAAGTSRSATGTGTRPTGAEHHDHPHKPRRP